MHRAWRAKKKLEIGEEAYLENRRKEHEQYVAKYGRDEINKRNREKYNPEKQKEWMNNYTSSYEDKNGISYQEAQQVRSKVYRNNNKEKIKEASKEYRQANLEVIIAKSAQYYKDNKEKINARNNEYYTNNKEAHAIRTFNTYARRKNADGNISLEDVEFLRDIQNNKCIYCLADLSEVNNEIDHQTSIINGGSNNIDNLAITCRECNRSKGPRNHEDFIEYLRIAHPDKYTKYTTQGSEEMPQYYEWLNNLELQAT